MSERPVVDLNYASLELFDLLIQSGRRRIGPGPGMQRTLLPGPWRNGWTTRRRSPRAVEFVYDTLIFSDALQGQYAEYADFAPWSVLYWVRSEC